MKTLIILIISVLFLMVNVTYAQEKADTSGVTFTDIQSAATATGTTATKGSTGKTVNKTPLKSNRPKDGRQTLWAIFLAGLAGGFAALLMPCIFPMLPLTVSYFTKNSGGKGSAVRRALLYGLSIMVIYVFLGLIVTIIFGADALNSLSTNGIFNFAFFLLIVAFAASFLGAFEITLPNSWVNKMDEKSASSGVIGLFFMAATLALVSFSCTGPIIGYLLVQTATSGALLGPAVGMLGFSLALAIPFALFAMFPEWLNSLPKSGGWLNSVKVTLGFLELALSLKFLSNVDLAYHWHWFDRELFLALWIVIFALMGLYLLGKLTFNHDSVLQYITVPRLFLAILVLSFTMYMVPGLWGAPLKSISAFLPPMATQDFDLSGVSPGNTAAPTSSGPHKFGNLFDKPKGFDPFFDYDEGIAYAKKVNKPVMIDFTGHACVNCRKMEANIWPDKEVSQRINHEYVLIQLYVDDKTDLDPKEQTVSKSSRQIITIGNKWSDLQITRFQANSQPFYVLLDPKSETTLVNPRGADFDAPEYLKFLDSGLNAFKAITH
ncbi:DUF255 domain-containing protein [Mucilaginibacter rubeus]|uniref:DUF255 domain-containing protein n=1 Tax=Mucilaginibacter rubeus TaxID=2027860 RepID=A0AAE6JJQ5_9SPHI|nr:MULTISPECIES: cytochrome c biogenesis protein CcdA [Mucilaginibacter]QEM07149.1 DUF255 domain-containing protein [Mucilaginibacter rubeus]QEM19604.1 DUF255 domain-containing protein [Mucilaginibacter gossypii]QTE43706.1 thioredoxin family protein [Mucilaginibacter rubeus]QTE50306.1 thioredoxin family protein [Mucilaginibacter rubeus]QTE55393.1 thioredoxin family protein [Mucilaginibacter rubeus]